MFMQLGQRPLPLQAEAGSVGVAGNSSSERFAIRWKGFQSNVLGTLEELHRVQDFSDVTLAAEDGTRVRAHRLVLASGSKYLRRVLLEASSSGDCCQLPVIIIPGINGEVLKAIVHYLYFGEANIDNETLAPFIDTAKRLSLKGMMNFESPMERDVAIGLSMLSKSILPPMDVVHNLPSALDQRDGLSILAQAASKANEQFVRLQQLQPEELPRNPESRKIGPRRRPTSESTNSSLFSNPLFEHDEDNPLNCGQPFPEIPGKAMNLSIKSHPCDAQTPPYADLPISLPEVSSSREMLAVPDGFRDRQHRAFQLSPSPTALDMSAHGPATVLSGRTSPFDGSSTSGSPGVVAFQQQFSVAAADDDDHALNKLTVAKQHDEDDGKRPVKKRKRAVEEELKFQAASPGSDESKLAKVNEPEVAPATFGPSNEKNWKSRQPRGCEICDRTFSNKFNLKQHVLNMHTPGRTVFCELCNKKVKNKWYLRRHKVTHHNAPLKK